MEKKSTTIYLVRHGTTKWNELRRYQGRADNPLDETGERQGALLENYFKDIPVDLGVTSPLVRARKTLQYCLASQPREVPVLVEPGVIEIDFGDADGLTADEIREKYPEMYRMYVLNEDRGHTVPPNGEPIQHVYDRMRDTILRIASEHPGETIVISSHGSAIQTFLNYAMGNSCAESERLVLCNVCVSCVEIDEDMHASVRFIDDRRHIPKELQFTYGSPAK